VTFCQPSEVAMYRVPDAGKLVVELTVSVPLLEIFAED
jgi:hypothetical protein